MSGKKTIIINLLGGPGCGKSVMAAALFVALKIRGYSVEYVQEFAKTLVWTKQFSRLNNQHYVSTKQYEILKQMDGMVDFIVTDGPLYHGLMYNMLNPDNTSDKDKTRNWILTCAAEFNNVNVMLKRGSFRYESEGRIQTEEQACEIDVVLRHILKQNGVDFKQIETFSSKDDVNGVVDDILTSLGMKA